MTARPVKIKKSPEKRKGKKPDNLIIVKDETEEKMMAERPAIETAEEKQRRAEEKYKASVNYILSVSNEKFDDIPHKWKVIIIVSLVIALILITFFRLRSLVDGFRQSANTVTNVQDDVKGYAADPNRTTNELITQIRNAAATAQSQNGSNDLSKIVDPFDLENSTLVINGETVKFSSGVGTLEGKTAAIEKMMYKGDFNGDGNDDIAFVVSIKDKDSVSWYLAAILGGESRTVVPAAKIGTDYPIITGIMGGEKKSQVFVAETAWKEQQTKIRTYTITDREIKEN